MGDRRWALYGEDGKIGSGKTTRRFRRMHGLLALEGITDGGASMDRRRFRPDVLKHLSQHYEGTLGVYAAVVQPGEIAVDDEVAALTAVEP